MCVRYEGSRFEYKCRVLVRFGPAAEISHVEQPGCQDSSSGGGSMVMGLMVSKGLQGNPHKESTKAQR